MSYYIADRITVNPEQCGGRPCVRGMRVRVVDVLEVLAAGLSFAEVREELPQRPKSSYMRNKKLP